MSIEETKNIYELLAFAALLLWGIACGLLAYIQISGFGIWGEKGSAFDPIQNRHRSAAIAAGIFFILGVVFLVIAAPHVA